MSMKAVAITAIVSVGTTLALVGAMRPNGGGAVSEVARSTEGPKLVSLVAIDPEDLGSQRNETLLTRRVKVTNTNTKAHVTLAVKHKNCGCTTVSIEKKSLAPGESTEVKLEISTGTAPGRLDASVVLEAATEGAVPRRTQDVPVRATYVSASQLVVLPQYVMVREYTGQPFERTIHLHPGTCADFKVSAVASDSPVISELTPTFTNKPEGGWTVSLRGTVPAKRQTAKVTIKTDCEEAAETFVSVLFDPVDPWQATPAGVAGRYEPNSPIERTISVENRVGVKATPSSIVIPDSFKGLLTAEIARSDTDSATAFKVVVRVRAQPAPTSITGELLVRDDQGRTIVVLPVGLYAPPIETAR